MVTWAALEPVATLEYMEIHPNGLKEPSMIWATIGDLVTRDSKHALAMVSESIANEDVAKNTRVRFITLSGGRLGSLA